MLRWFVKKIFSNHFIIDNVQREELLEIFREKVYAFNWSSSPICAQKLVYIPIILFRWHDSAPECREKQIHSSLHSSYTNKGSLLKLQLIENTSKHLFHCKISVKLHTSLCKQYLDKRKKKPDNRGPTALFFNWYVVIRKRLLRQFSISCSFNLGFVDGWAFV